MASYYTAYLKRSPGRKAFNIEFRHPLRNDSNNKPGRKIHRALGTDDEKEANRLLEAMNELLRDESLWSIGARPLAAKRFGEKIAEIFYGEIEPKSSAPLISDRYIKLPTNAEGYARVLLLGVPGAGKTTLVRQFLGTHPTSERFPATSVNRTTTFPTEIVLHEGGYEGVVTFMSEYEARFEVEEAVSATLVEAIDGNTNEVARVFLEKSDMRFRLKYLLGDVKDGDDEIDPYDDPIIDDIQTEGDEPSSTEQERNESLVREYIKRIESMAVTAKEQYEAEKGDTAHLSGIDRQNANDEIQDKAINAQEYLELVSDILSELKSKFEIVDGLGGELEKTTTGWPKAWHLKVSSNDRARFIKAVRSFSDNHFRYWGKLLTPLVSSIRIQGPFKPAWCTDIPRLVLLDTEGLGHKASYNADFPEHMLPLVDAADVVLLVESAKSGMTNIALGKAIEAATNTGNSRKLAVVFTGMDLVRGPNLKGRAKLDHVFGGLRNVIENQIAKNVSLDAARSLFENLKENTFYVGNIDQLDPVAAKPELERLTLFLTKFQPQVSEPDGLPKYRDDKLGFAIQEAAQEFRSRWRGYLGLSPSVMPQHYNTIKALSRRYAEGWDDGFSLRPASNLVSGLIAAISRYLETPIGWTGEPSAEQKRETIDRIKVKAAKKVRTLAIRRVRENPRPQWQEAYSYRGAGSTTPRAYRIESIFEKSVPVPTASANEVEVWQFLDDVKGAVERSIDEVKEEVLTAKAPKTP